AGGTLAAALSQNAASAGVPMPLVISTVKAATGAAAGQTAAAGLASAKIAAIAEGVLKTMLLTKLKIATAVLLAVGLAAGGVVVFDYSSVTAQEQQVRPQTLATLTPRTAFQPAPAVTWKSRTVIPIGEHDGQNFSVAIS